MNRRELYRPLGERTLVNYQVQHLARRYDFGKESLVARLLVEEINHRMEETESILGIVRVKPFELYVQKAQNQARLPLFCPEYLDPILGGGDFGMSRQLILKRCLQSYLLGYPKGGRGDLLRIIDPWSLVRKKGPSSYVDQLYQDIQPYSKTDAASWDCMIEQIQPVLPTDRLQAPDLLAPGRVLKELTEFVAAEAGLGRVVARQLVEEVIALRHICCPRTKELKPYEMPLIVTHVSARLSEDVSTRFRQLTPVIITVWKPEELDRQPDTVPGFLAQLKRRIVRVCFEAYRQNGLLTLMELQWIFQLSSARISELIRSVQREHNLVVPTPGTILDAGRSMTHKDVIVSLHLQGYTVKDIARMTHHSPRAVDNYIGTFEAVLILYLFGVPPELMARLLKRGISLINEHLKLVREHYRDHQEIKEYLASKGVKI